MKQKSAKFNYIYNLLYQVLNVLMPLATAPYLSRVIGPLGVGIFSYSNSMACYFGMVGMLGLTNYGSRSIAQCQGDHKKLNRTFSSLVYMQVALSFIMCILYAFYVAFIVQDNKLISWIQGLVVSTSLINLNWFFWGLEEFKITVTRSFIVKIINFICIFIFVRNNQDLWKYTLIMALGTFASNIPLVFLTKKFVRLVKIPFKEIWHHFIPNVILFIPFLSTTLYRTIDKVMLGWFTDYKQVGYYENADKIIVVCLGCVTALGQVMMPRASNLIAKGKMKESNILLHKSFNFTTIFASAIAFGLIAISDYFVPVFFGNSFLETIPVLVILGVTFIFLSWSNVLNTQVLMARSQDKIFLIATTAGAVFNTIMNGLFVPLLKAKVLL